MICGIGFGLPAPPTIKAVSTGWHQLSLQGRDAAKLKARDKFLAKMKAARAGGW